MNLEPPLSSGQNPIPLSSLPIFQASSFHIHRSPRNRVLTTMSRSQNPTWSVGIDWDPTAGWGIAFSLLGATLLKVGMKTALAVVGAAGAIGLSGTAIGLTGAAVWLISKELWA